jgi:hypothetical protein
MLKRFWNWLLGKTTIDERVIEVIEAAKKPTPRRRNNRKPAAKK